MRELIVVFNGNEISLGVILATWLLWTAAGSMLASRFVPGQTSTRTAVALLECLLAVSLPLTIWAVRACKGLFQTVWGELVGPGAMLLTCFVGLSVFCFLSGYLFVVVTRAYQQLGGSSAGVASSAAYLLDACGSALGGLLASLVLLRFLDSFQIAAIIALLNLCMAAICLLGVRRKAVLASALIVGTAGAPLFLYLVPYLGGSSQTRLWRGFRLLESRDSIYGNLVVTETGNIRSIYDNGTILASAPDEAASEEAVHYALLQHPAPKSVLLIGGGAKGSIGEGLKHLTVQRLDYVELDPAVIDIAKEFFPTQSAPWFRDPRVHIHYADGRQYLRSTHRHFDVIVLDLPEPQTAQLNRFYTTEFFHTAREHLTPGGLLAFQLRASEDYVSPDLAEFLRCIYHTLHGVFPYVATLPGPSLHFFATNEPNVLTDDPQTLIGRLKARHLQTRYVREYFIPFRMMPDRMEQIRTLLQPLATTPVNGDFEPVAYYFDVMLWGAQFKRSHYGWFRSATHIAFARLMAWTLVAAVALAILLANLPKRTFRLRASAVCCAFSTGFTLMVLQLFLLLGFQSIYGYVYHQLAILLGMFMAGLALGNWSGIERVHATDDLPLRLATVTQLTLAVATPLLMAILSLAHDSDTIFVSQQFVFPTLAAACGALGGYQIPLLMEIYLRDHERDRGLGVIYAVDLLGGCVGALLLSSYLIPVFGFWKTAWLSAVVNLAPALLAARASGGSRMSVAQA